MTRKRKAGIQMADALLEFIHMMYNKDTAKGVLQALIMRLQEMKVTKRKTVKYTFEFTEEEARWLKEVMQNRISCYCKSGCVDETAIDHKMRKSFWAAMFLVDM